MNSQILYQVSIIAAFVAGMVALFAPCCISYLLPAYLGNVFKERRRVLFMTLVYSLGIFIILLPIVLGAKALANLFFRLHDQTYIVGGIFMMVVAGMSFLGVKLPVPRFGSDRVGNKTDILSVFLLGTLSGITSACCAPVLAGVLTLSSLSPTALQALGVGAAYVFGMVAPLYIASVLIDRGNILEKPIFRRQLVVVKLGGRRYPIFITNIIAAAIFFSVGALTLVLTATGRLGMSMAESGVMKFINNIAFRITEITAGAPLLNGLFVVGGLCLLYRLVKKAFNFK